MGTDHRLADVGAVRVIAAPPVWALWLACSLWLLVLVLGAVAVVLVRRLLHQWAPTLSPLLSMFAVAPAIPPMTAAAQSAATPDICEYSDHEWSPRTSTYGDGVTTHYCLRCGYTEHVPGT